MKTLKFYRGYTLRQVLEKLPKQMTRQEKRDYINNCKRITECQNTGFNLNDIEPLQNYNFLLINYYLTH